MRYMLSLFVHHGVAALQSVPDQVNKQANSNHWLSRIYRVVCSNSVLYRIDNELLKVFFHTLLPAFVYNSQAA